MPPIQRQRPRQIVVMGGGGFLKEPRNPRLDRYIISLAKKRSPKICFVPTASGDSRDRIRQFHHAFENYPCRPSVLTLFERDARDPAEFLLDQDMIYVGGGNTANLLAIWQIHAIDKIVRQAWNNGIILCGVSAGMNCWFESSVTDSFGSLRNLDDGLALLPGSACPHFNSQPNRRPTFHRLIREKKLPAGIAADDGAAIHYVDQKIHRCVASRHNALAYRVSLSNGHIVEEPLPTILLSRDGTFPD